MREDGSAPSYCRGIHDRWRASCALIVTQVCHIILPKRWVLALFPDRGSRFFKRGEARVDYTAADSYSARIAWLNAEETPSVQGLRRRPVWVPSNTGSITRRLVRPAYSWAEYNSRDITQRTVKLERRPTVEQNANFAANAFGVDSVGAAPQRIPRDDGVDDRQIRSPGTCSRCLRALLRRRWNRTDHSACARRAGIDVAHSVRHWLRPPVELWPRAAPARTIHAVIVATIPAPVREFEYSVLCRLAHARGLRCAVCLA